MHVLTDQDLAFWEENGYVVVHNAVPQANLDAVVDVLWGFLGMDRNNPETWYPEERRKNSMVELYQHPALWNNRQHPRVYGAFADLWKTDKLWVSLDRVGMNPPDRPDWGYKGFTHWDIDTTVRPLPVFMQGVLYLTDTAANQGGFHCVAGFHRTFDEWVKSQPANRNPYRPDLTGFESKPIPGKAGDLVIWNSMLPHGNGQNLSSRPRLAQYITMFPAPESKQDKPYKPTDEEERLYRIKAWRERLPPRGKAFPGDPRSWEQQHGATAALSDLGKKLLGIESWD